LTSKESTEDVTEVTNVALREVEVLWTTTLLTSESSSRRAHLSYVVIFFSLRGIT
jgi:hypothetical protein